MAYNDPIGEMDLSVKNIQALDLTAEIHRMHTKDGLEMETAEKAADLYRKFLLLRVKHGRGLTPSKLIDTAWHQHLADTEKYTADCKKICGTFIHHDPKILGEKMEEQYARTKVLFEQEFGIPLDRLHTDENRMAMGCGC